MIVVLCDRCENRIETTVITTTLKTNVVLADGSCRGIDVRVTVEPNEPREPDRVGPGHHLCKSCFGHVATQAIAGKTRIESDPKAGPA